MSNSFFSFSRKKKKKCFLFLSGLKVAILFSRDDLTNCTGQGKTEMSSSHTMRPWVYDQEDSLLNIYKQPLCFISSTGISQACQTLHKWWSIKCTSWLNETRCWFKDTEDMQWGNPQKEVISSGNRAHSYMTLATPDAGKWKAFLRQVKKTWQCPRCSCGLSHPCVLSILESWAWPFRFHWITSAVLFNDLQLGSEHASDSCLGSSPSPARSPTLAHFTFPWKGNYADVGTSQRPSSEWHDRHGITTSEAQKELAFRGAYTIHKGQKNDPQHIFHFPGHWQHR